MDKNLEKQMVQYLIEKAKAPPPAPPAQAPTPYIYHPGASGPGPMPGYYQPMPVPGPMPGAGGAPPGGAPPRPPEPMESQILQRYIESQRRGISMVDIAFGIALFLFALGLYLGVAGGGI